MADVEGEGLAEERHADPLVPAVVHPVLLLAGVGPHPGVDMVIWNNVLLGDNTPSGRAVLAPWSPLGQVGSVKVAWVQQYALKIPPATPCIHMDDEGKKMTPCR